MKFVDIQMKRLIERRAGKYCRAIGVTLKDVRVDANNKYSNIIHDARKALILRLREDGFTNKQVADLLNISQPYATNNLRKAYGYLQFDKKFQKLNDKMIYD